MVKVGLVCPYSLDVPGGVQHHVLELAEALLGLGQDVSVLAPADRVDALPPYVVPAGGAVAVPYNGSVARLSFGPGSVARVRRWLADERPDLLHVHEPTAPSLPLLALWAAEVPVVATFHASMPAGSRVMAAVGGVIRAPVERISARIAVSEHALATMQRHVGGTGVVVPNGVWTASFRDAVPDPSWSARDGGATVAFLGRMDEPRKGLDVLVAAWPEVVATRPEARLLVAGHGDADRVRMRIADALGQAAGSVEVLGGVDARAKARLLRSADLFVAPHTGKESFGIVLVEAMAAGAPVLASDLPAFAAVLDDGRLGRMFPAGDPAGLAASAGALLDAPPDRVELARRAAVAAQSYDWAVVADRVLRIYETVAVADRRRAPA